MANKRPIIGHKMLVWFPVRVCPIRGSFGQFDSFSYGGNFRIFRIEERHTKITKFSLHNNVNMFYVTMLSCTNI